MVTTQRRVVPRWVMALLPLAGLAALLLLLVGRNPVARLADGPPVEELSVERTVLSPGVIELRVRNTGPDRVTIAQVLVNDAYRQFAVDEPALGRLATTWIAVPYPWEEGIPLHVVLVTSTGATFEHEIATPVTTPDVGARSLFDYGLLGVYIGVIPVALGLLWFPSLRRASRPVMDFVLAFTVGLLAFLFVDAAAEGLEQASGTPGALGGVELFALGLLGVLAVMAWVGARLSRREAGLRGPNAVAGLRGPNAVAGLRGPNAVAGLRGPNAVDAIGGLALSYAVAVGIGLHNLGEGLAVGAAVAAGEVALGTSLVLGFAAHNVTEGLAIAAPVAGDTARPPLAHFVALGAVAGLPTIAGAWAGGFAFTPAWASLAFGVAAGAVLQVVWTVGRRLVTPTNAGLKVAGFVLGVALMYATGLLTA